MNIQPINNTNFKGVFTDKQWHNLGNWKMEYTPYSWESSNTSKMAPKEKINILASKLPDNEEIYKVKSEGYQRKIESSEDIFGTITYYRNFETDTVRKNIIEVPSMDRETSLDVLRKKLEKFMELKKEYGKKMLKDIKENMSKINKSGESFNHYSADYDAGVFSSIRSKSDNKSYMDTCTKDIVKESQKMYNSSKEYVKLRDSMDELRINIENARHEVARLKEARLNKNLIDISRRDIYDPNRPLWSALQDVKAAYTKLVALPHKTTSVNELIDEAGVKLNDAKLPDKVIKFVDGLISKRV